MKKPTLITFLVLSLCFLNLKTKAADVSDLTYVNNTVYITITDCDEGANGELVIPPKIEGLPVKLIARSAFERCSQLTNIILPSTLKEIKRSAFAFCDKLETINLPNSIETIEYGCFYECKSLINLSIPNKIIQIEDSCFYGCSELKSITIPNTVRVIGGAAFYGCKNLTSVTIGENVTRIGSEAFFNCPKLVRIEFKGNAPEYAVYLAFIDGAVVLIRSSATGFNQDISGIPILRLDEQIDSDNDGVPDVDDAFPNDPTEVADSDNDGVGDNADARSGEVIVELQGQVGQLMEQNSQLQAQVSELSKGPTLEQIQDGRLGSIVITPIPNTNTAILNIDIEQSDDLKTWTLYRNILESIPLPEGKKFYRFALDK